MADIDIEALLQPVSDDQPCGPDLDMEDFDFMGFMAEIEGLLPVRYFSFDPKSLKFDDYYGRINEFNERTRDVRLLTLLAKLKILQGDIDGFINALEATRAVLKEFWQDVHPQADFLDLRIGQLATLDDMPISVLPFQHATLFRSNRAGAITLRKWQIAQGEVNPREEEDSIDAGTILSEIGEADPEAMAALVAKLERGREALAGIRLTCIEEAGIENAPGLEKLPQAFDSIIEMLKQGTGTTDAEGEVAEGEAVAGGPTSAGAYVQLPTGDIASREDAIEALFQAEKYYAQNEPSSPVVLLLREARSTANKNFAELVNDLVPYGVSDAFFALGKEPWFEISLTNLNDRNPAPDYDAEEETEDSSWEDIGLDDEETADGSYEESGEEDAGDEEITEEEDTSSEDAGEDSYSEGASEEEETETEAEESETSDEEEVSEDDEAAADEDVAEEDESSEEEVEEAAEADVEEEAEEEAEEEIEEEVEEGPRFAAKNRPAALALIDKVLAYYRVAEPSSPVILMLEKCVEFSTKNFIDILGRVLPEGHLKVRERDE